MLLAEGKDAPKFFKDEGGGHRWQRTPPTEKRGRVHTSTVTVAVLNETGPKTIEVNPDDLIIDYYKASGAGGQHRNRTLSGCRIKHIPTGIIIERCTSRSSYQNKDSAMEDLKQRLQSAEYDRLNKRRNSKRKTQIGSGMRGDKIRTYREQDDTVIDHRSNKKASLKKLRRGDWGEIKR